MSDFSRTPTNIEAAQHARGMPLVFKFSRVDEGQPVLGVCMGISRIGFDLLSGPITDDPGGDIVPVHPFVGVRAIVNSRGRIQGSLDGDLAHTTLSFADIQIPRYCGDLGQVTREIDDLMTGKVDETVFAGAVMARAVLRSLEYRQLPRAKSYVNMFRSALVRLI